MSTDSKRYDAKPALHLVPMQILWMAACAFMHGLRKGYAKDSWKHATDPLQYLSACLRHITAILDGEEIDAEGERHINGAAASLCIFCWHVAHGFRVQKVEPTGWVMDGQAEQRSESSSGNGKHTNGHASV